MNLFRLFLICHVRTLTPNPYGAHVREYESPADLIIPSLKQFTLLSIPAYERQLVKPGFKPKIPTEPTLDRV